MGNTFADVIKNHIGNAKPSCVPASGGSVTVADRFYTRAVAGYAQRDRRA
jgi:hypothetical protein